MPSKSRRTLSIENDSYDEIIQKIPPKLLGNETYKKLEDGINKKKENYELFQHFNEKINNIKEKIGDLLYHKLNELQYDFCIGGSVAWNKIFKDHYDSPELMSDYEKSAIHDLTIDLYNYIKINNNDEFVKLKKELRTILSNEIEEIKLEPELIEQRLNNIVLSVIELDKSKFKIKIFINFQGDEYELFNIYFYEIIGIGEIGKLIDLSNIKDENNYLNIYGLYIYNYISKNSRKPVKNDYDVYNIRDEIYQKYILIDKELNDDEKSSDTIFIHNNKLKILYSIIFAYELAFNKNKIEYRNIYNKYFIQNIKKIIFYETENLKIFDNILRYYLIERFRPYINFIILLINQDLSEKKLPTLFVVGGDCCRRYKYDISRTEDIDTKLYLEDVSQFSEVEDIIVKRVNQLISYFIVNKNTIIDKNELLEYLKNKGYDEDFINFDANDNLIFSYEDIETNLKHELIYYLNDNKSTFFRFRHNFSSVFPVDLYASDFQIKNNYRIYKMNNDGSVIEKILYEDTKLTFDMAYLDISVDTIKYEKNIIRIKPNDILSNNLEIGRLLFLITDLINTYNNDESSIVRLITGKSKKDYLRFINLVKIYKSSLFTEKIDERTGKYILDETDFSETIFKSEKDRELILEAQINNKEERAKLDDSSKDIIGDLNNVSNVINKFATYFINDYKKKRKTNTSKIEFSFDLEKINSHLGFPLRRGGTKSQSKSRQSLISKSRQSLISKSRQSLISKSRMIKLKNINKKNKENELIEEIEFNDFIKDNKEFNKIYKLINKPKSTNPKLLEKLLENLSISI